MPKKIDWLYARKSCVTCQKAKAYTEEAEVKVGETVDASKNRIPPADALALLQTKAVAKVVAMRGAKVVTFDLKKDPPDNDTLLASIIGPSGNLRAPAAIVGKTILIGFHPEAYAEVLGVA